MPRSVPEQPYQSAFDLPSFQKLQSDLRAAKLVRIFMGMEAKEKLAQLESDIQLLGQTVDHFYAILGPRNWVFHDQLSLDRVRSLLDASSPEDAERALIQYYKEGDWLTFWAQRVARTPSLAPWRQLLLNALSDYKAGRYYSTSLLLLATMDGFVNEVDRAQRRGLHARDPQEMKSWDSVTGHHMGLTNVMRVIFKSFKAPRTEPVTELYRNGIMHGNIVNYDNDVVATKAWNYFFSVLDWATDRERQTQPEARQPSWRELLQKMSENEKHKRVLATWNSTTIVPGDLSWNDDRLVLAAADFLRTWQRGNFGGLADSLAASPRRRNSGKPAGRMREQFARFPISGFSVDRVQHVAPAIGVVDATVIREGAPTPIEMRWVHETEVGDIRASGMADAAWRRVLDGCPVDG